MNKRAQYWGLAAAWTLLIYSTLCIVRPVSEFLRERSLLNVMVWGAFLLLFALMVYSLSCVRWKRALTYLLFIGIAAIYAVVLCWLKIPEERVHLIQYGVLVCLVIRALRLDLPTIFAYSSAFLLTAWLGLVDECIQHLLPSRYFEWRDVGLNAIGAGLGLMLWINFHQERSV